MFPAKWKVMLAFYRGRFHLYRNEFIPSVKELRSAFSSCSDAYQKNKKKILKFLIPVEMNLNKFPTKEFLQKYQLDEYLVLSQACMAGDI